MGWTFVSNIHSRKDLIQYLNKRTYSDPIDGKCIKFCVRGNVLWSIWELFNKETQITKRFIGCDLMQNGGREGWGYRDMEESCHPYYYTCPLSYFDLVPLEGSNIEGIEEDSLNSIKTFREKCKQYQEEKRSPKLWKDISKAWDDIQKTKSNKNIIVFFHSGWKAKGQFITNARLTQIWPTRGICNHGFLIKISRKAIKSFEIE